MTTPHPSEGAEVAKLRDQLNGALGGDYTLGAVLGAGRCGVVFLARNTATNRDVALKVSWDDADARAQLARETSLTAEVEHPHVLPMRKLFLAKRIFVVEMPLASGGTLDDLLERGGGASFHYVRGILRQVAGAFDAAHALGIVHGALCPEKILLDENGQCLVSDFGLRLPALSRSVAPRPSQLGAAPYMPLEQRRDRGDTDGRVDQYALAIIAYELLRGRRTWHYSGEGVLAVEPLEIMVNRPIAPGVPLSANAALKRATSPGPGHRFSSVGDFVRAFSGDTPDAVPAQSRKGRRRVTPRQRAWLLVPLVLVLAIVGSRPSVRGAVRSLWPADWTLRGGDQPAADDEGQLPPEFPDTTPLTTSDTGRRSAGDVARVRSRVPARPAIASGPRTTTGVITVTLTGGNSAFVVIDGQARGGTPLSWRANVGRHVISLRGEDRYSPAALNVDLAGGDTARAAFVVAGRR